MLTNIHPATGVEDAIAQLDSHIPLLHAERKLVVESLYDLAFREGARQGRQAGIEHAQNVLREEALARQYDGPVDVYNTLHNLATSLNPEDNRHEYPDPTSVIREKLANLRARKNGR